MDQGGASSAAAVRVIRTAFAGTGANEMIVVGPSPLPSATGALQALPSADTSTLYPRGYPPPPAPAPPNGPPPGEVISISVSAAGSGSSIWNHIPGCCGAPASQRI